MTRLGGWLLVAWSIVASATMGRAEDTTYKAKEIDAPLTNPFCGWGIWAGPRFLDSRQFSLDYNTVDFGDGAPLFSYVLVDWMWADLEPKEGDFAWREMDAVVRYWQRRGKQIQVRLWVTTDPGWNGAPGNKVCPDWLWKAGVKFHTYKGEGGVEQRCPAYADPSWENEYLPRLKCFLTTYRQRYSHPGSAVSVNHVMGFGDWGEWHTMWSHYPWPDRKTKRRVLLDVIRTYLQVFAPDAPEDAKLPELGIAHVYDEDCPGNTPLDEALRRQALDLAVAKGFTLSRNGFIDGLSGWPQDLIKRYWAANPTIAEANWTYDQVKDHKTHGTVREHVDSFLKWHSAYAHMYMHAASYQRALRQDRSELERGLRTGGLGYRFVPLSVSWNNGLGPGDQLVFKQQWANRNVSRCAKPFRLKVYLARADGITVYSGIDSEFDPRSWVAGKVYDHRSSFRLPPGLPAGDYTLRIALVDEWGDPRVRLGIEGGDAQLRYVLGKVRIGEAPAKSELRPSHLRTTILVFRKPKP
jgi:hypothetical protein